MPYQFKWLVEGQILYQRYYGHYTAEDESNSIMESTNLLQQVTNPIIVIIDMVDMTGSDSNMRQNVENNRDLNFDMIRCSYNITKSRIQDFKVDTINKSLTGFKYHFVNSLDEALDHIRQHAPDIDLPNPDDSGVAPC